MVRGWKREGATAWAAVPAEEGASITAGSGSGYADRVRHGLMVGTPAKAGQTRVRKHPGFFVLFPSLAFGKSRVSHD